MLSIRESDGNLTLDHISRRIKYLNTGRHSSWSKILVPPFLPICTISYVDVELDLPQIWKTRRETKCWREKKITPEEIFKNISAFLVNVDFFYKEHAQSWQLSWYLFDLQMIISLTFSSHLREHAAYYEENNTIKWNTWSEFQGVASTLTLVTVKGNQIKIKHKKMCHHARDHQSIFIILLLYIHDLRRICSSILLLPWKL